MGRTNAKPDVVPDLSRVTPAKLDRLRQLIAELALHRADRHLITNSNGDKLQWLMDLRTLFLDGAAVDLATDVFWEVFADFESLQIAGLELGSIPFIGAVVQKGRALGKNVNGLCVRRSRKKEGLMRRVEGAISDAPIVMVDDLMNSGSSLVKVAQALADEGHAADHGFVFVKFREPSPTVRKAIGVEVLPLFQLAEFGVSLEVAKAPGRPVIQYETAWTFVAPLKRPRFEIVVPKCNPAVDGERVYFGTDDRIFYAVDLKTGELVWDFHVDRVGSERGIWSSPAVSGGRVIFGAYDGNLYCLDGATGKPVWVNGEGDYVGSSPAVAEDLGLVFIGLEFGYPSSRGSLQALDLATGEKRWQYDVRELLHGSPLYSRRKHVVGLGTNDSTYVMLDARTGRELWLHRCQGPVKWHGSFGPGDEVVAFSSYDGHVYVLEVDTGKTIFRMKGEFSFLGSPLIVGDYVFCGNSDKGIYIGNYRKGELAARIETDARIFATPAFADNYVWIGNNAGALFQIEQSESGGWQVVGRNQLPDRILSKMATSSVTGLHYVLTGDARLFAFKANSGHGRPVT